MTLAAAPATIINTVPYGYIRTVWFSAVKPARHDRQAAAELAAAAGPPELDRCRQRRAGRRRRRRPAGGDSWRSGCTSPRAASTGISRIAAICSMRCSTSGRTAASATSASRPPRSPGRELAPHLPHHRRLFARRATARAYRSSSRCANGRGATRAPPPWSKEVDAEAAGLRRPPFRRLRPDGSARPQPAACCSTPTSSASR